MAVNGKPRRRRRKPAAEWRVANIGESRDAGAVTWETIFGEPGANRTSSGESVGPRSAQRIACYYRAVELISTAAAKLPVEVWRLAPDGRSRSRDHNHPAWPLLTISPHLDLDEDAYQFRRLQTAWAIHSGNSYSFIERDEAGRPRELIELSSSSVTPLLVVDLDRPRRRQKKYVVWTGDDRIQISGILDASEILHIRGLGWDPLEGTPLIDLARETLGLKSAGGHWHGTFFRNAAAPKIAIIFPGRITDKTYRRVIDQFAAHQGRENWHKVKLVEGGAQIKELTLSPVDTRLLELDDRLIREIAVWLGIPPHKLGDTTRTSFASLESENQDYLDSAIDPWLVTWEAQCRLKLLSTAEIRTHQIEFSRSEMIRTNLAAKAAFYRSALAGAPFLTREEVRQDIGRNPEPEAGEYIMPLNMRGAGDE